MPGVLKCDLLDLTNDKTTQMLIESLCIAANSELNLHRLEVSKRYYFRAPDGDLSDEPGWYVICSGDEPIYVGTAENLNSRLNSENGSRDQFANPKRMTDSERNFIKSFDSRRILGSAPLMVRVMPESQVVSSLNLESPLSKTDRNNVEKVLNLLRQRIVQPLGSGS